GMTVALARRVGARMSSARALAVSVSLTVVVCPPATVNLPWASVRMLLAADSRPLAPAATAVSVRKAIEPVHTVSAAGQLSLTLKTPAELTARARLTSFASGTTAAPGAGAGAAPGPAAPTGGTSPPAGGAWAVV